MRQWVDHAGDVIADLLGLRVPRGELEAHHLALRALVVYLLALLLVRLGGKRLLGRNSAFDFVVTIVLGAVASAAITGAAPFLPTLAAATTVAALHFVTSFATCRSQALAELAEGDAQVLFRDGRPDARAMRRSHVTREDLEMACREEGLDGLADADRIVLERNGRFSVKAKAD
jgi:uncharacterized membrane protein YcaP (DUF421 family)